MDAKKASYVVRSFEDFKALVLAGSVKTVDDVDRIIRESFPDGLDVHLDKESFGGCGYMIGFNLNRYVYTNKIAAELHALKDNMLGITGASYGFPFDPYVTTHKATEDRPEHYEVYTN